MRRGLGGWKEKRRKETVSDVVRRRVYTLDEFRGESVVFLLSGPLSLSPVDRDVELFQLCPTGDGRVQRASRSFYVMALRGWKIEIKYAVASCKLRDEICRDFHAHITS